MELIEEIVEGLKKEIAVLKEEIARAHQKIDDFFGGNPVPKNKDDVDAPTPPNAVDAEK